LFTYFNRRAVGADIVVQFYCAYYDPVSGLLIVAPAAVKRHYLRTTFIFDLMGVRND